MSDKKKKYERPEITKRSLKIDEVVLAKCKSNSVGFTGPTGNRCRRGNRPCKEYSTS